MTKTKTNTKAKTMTKTLTALAAVATIAVASIAAPSQAEARGRGGAIAAGIIGGLAVGALIGSAAAANGPYYGGGHRYGQRYYGGGIRHYGASPVYYGPRCYRTRQRIWTGYDWRVRPVRVCH